MSGMQNKAMSRSMTAICFGIICPSPTHSLFFHAFVSTLYIWAILLQTAHQSKFDILKSSEILFTTYIHKIASHVFQDFAEKFFFSKTSTHELLIIF